MPGMAVDDEHVLGAEPPGDLGHHRHERRVVDAEELPLRAGRVRERAEDVEDGADRDLAARTAGVAHRRVQRLGEQEADADLVDAARHVGRRRGRCARRAPRARRRCPHFDETARLPCFAIGTPAPATTNAVVVEMLKVRSPSPPVPQVSMQSGALGRTGVARARIARAKPVISSTVSPFIRIAVTSERDLRGASPRRP